MSRKLAQAILELRAKVEQHGSERRDTRVSAVRDARDEPTGNGLRGMQLSADVQALTNALLTAVARDCNVYQRTVEFGLPDPATPATPSLPLAAGFVQATAHELAPWLKPPATVHEMEQLAPPSRHYAMLLQAEISRLSDEALGMTGTAKTSLAKLQSAYKAFTEQRHTDAHTILKNISRNEPNNNMLLFLLSQFQYLMASLGHSETLPDARDLAQKAMIDNERFNQQQMIFIRYHSAAAETQYDPAKALGWMREHGLLHVGLFLNQQGLASFQSLPLKAWGLLAGIDTSHWTAAETENMKTLVMDVVGGGWLYFALLRGKLQEDALRRKDPLPHADDIEAVLVQAHQAYTVLVPQLAEFPTKTSPLPWLVRSRYLNTLMQAAPRPTFDQILLNIAFNAQYWRIGSYPDPEVCHVLGDPHFAYWKLWAQTLTPLRERRQPQTFPAADALLDAQALPLCDQLLELLRQEEAARIKADVWDKVRPWMIQWSLDHLLAAGTGSNQPRSRFAPRNTTLSALYQRWAKSTRTSILYSDLIHAMAGNGGFGNVQEVMAAFEGAYRLIDDPAHGLAAVQKRALQAAKKQDPAQYGKLHIADERVGTGKLLLALLPLGLVGGIVGVAMSTQNLGQAIGLTLALAGFVGIAMIGLSKKD